MMQEPTDPALTSYLADRDEPCPRCGYNLRALTGQTCPECGAALRLRVGLVEPRLGAYVMAVGSGFAGFGGALLFTLLALLSAPGDWWLDDGFPASLFLITLLLTSAAALAVTLAGRRRFLRLSLGAQRVLAGLACGYVLVMGVLVLATFND